MMKRPARSHIQSGTVMWNAVEDVKCRSYPNLSKNTIKIKYSSVLSFLLVLLASQPYFYCLAVSLTVGLAISYAVLMASEVTID